MARFVAVSREHHAAKRWQRATNYGFSAADAVVPIVGAELFRSALAMPVAFVEQSGRYQLMAVLSPAPGRNLFVGQDGRWLGGYVPAFYRSYPFRLAAREGTDESVLCVDEDSGLVVDAKAAGEDFLDADGNVSQAVKPIFDLLVEAERSRKGTQLAVSALVDAGVVQPWPIKLKTPQAEQTIGGLHRIDEAALNALGDESFLKLRKAAALPVAYGQLLSMGQLGVFEPLAKLHAQLAQTAVARMPESVDKLLEMPSDDIVRFR
jgi:hypothetical protein